MIRGKVWKYGDNINTDIISPPAYMELPIKEAAKYAMSPIDENFAKEFKEGDILVAGKNLGSGSSRETAPLTLYELGVRTIVAQSFARIFYRNAVNIGILAIECPETDRIEMGDIIEINYENGIINNLTKNEKYKCDKIPDHIMAIIKEGGLINYIVKKLQNKSS
ncbi:MAG TPA: 3-isopropylmalate dehydratase small subunit [Tissierellaceae bacterium]